MPLHEAIKRARTPLTQDDLLARMRRLGVKIAQPTLSGWETGRARPSLEELATLEDAIPRPRGYVLRAAGFAVEAVSPEDAIRTDPRLNDVQREALLAIYDRWLGG